MFNSIKENKGITLVALVVTVIILLILASISIASLTGNGIFEKAKLAKEKQENAQIKEDETLSDYENEIKEYIVGNRDQNKKYRLTLLFDDNLKTGNITFLDNHTINEFDSIKFIYGETINGNQSRFQEKEYSKEIWLYGMSLSINDSDSVLSLSGVNNRLIEFNKLSETGFSVCYQDQYIVYRIYGVNYN